ncbi:MAG: 4Fe-4S dicluster domain-containing protein [Planctomycetota bacterium]|nr:4Fe-4S dicluster domain-containing protein [Planctomycetota bacterium]MDI6787747.1 4Fe-4S dicluster domain-containing protein [Planctomycetota bacterium]
MLDKLRQRIKELLENKTIGVFIGYEQGDNPELARPVMITSAEEVDKLIYDNTCLSMLSKYLLKPEVKASGRCGVIASYSNLRAIIGLLQEHQVTRDDVYIIAVSSGEKMPDYYDEIIDVGHSTHNVGRTTHDEMITDLLKKPPAERWAFWENEFKKCIRCYACRQICPLCYCNRCIADKNQPQWILTSPHLKGNFAWNVIRAYHLSGRCIDCGECERACPVNIPLMLLNKIIYNNIKTNFGYEAGFDPSVPPPLATYNPEDKENFII